MFDNLREDARESPLFQDGPLNLSGKTPRMVRVPERILGLNAPQRFIVSVMLFLVTSVLGVLVLLATQKVVLF